MKKLLFTVGCWLCSPSVFAQAVASDPAVVHHASAELTTVGLRFDVGGAFGYGVGVLHVWEDNVTRARGLGASFWRAVGLDLRALSLQGDTLDAVQINAVGRLSFMSCSAAGFEATLGVATAVGDRGNTAQPSTVAVGSVGAFMGVHYVLLGYSYTVPLGPFERPDWLAGHQFSVRVEIPVERVPTHEYDEPEAPRSDGAYRPMRRAM